MKRYILTGPKIAGQLEIIYREGSLIKIDMSDADLVDIQKSWLLKNISLSEMKLEAMMILLKDCTLVQDDYEITLDDFKREYPYSRNSHLLPPIWNKLSASHKVIAWEQAREYRKYCERNEWYKPKIAAKWLKDKEYLNSWKKL